MRCRSVTLNNKGDPTLFIHTLQLSTMPFENVHDSRRPRPSIEHGLTQDLGQASAEDLRHPWFTSLIAKETKAINTAINYGVSTIPGRIIHMKDMTLSDTTDTENSSSTQTPRQLPPTCFTAFLRRRKPTECSNLNRFSPLTLSIITR